MPFRWKNPKNAFWAGQSDYFHRNVTNDFIYTGFAVMKLLWRHTFVVLTKRYERLGKMLGSSTFFKEVDRAGRELFPGLWKKGKWGDNIVIGVSVGCEEYMKRASVLSALPRRMTKAIFVSPMIGPVDLPTAVRRALRKNGWVMCGAARGSAYCTPPPCRDEWQISLRDQCREIGVPFFLLRRYHEAWLKKFGGKCMELPPALLRPR